MIRVLLVDDEVLIRNALRAKLAGEPDIAVIGECGNADETVQAIASLRPDVVFLDVQMPGQTGFAVLEEIGVDKMPLVVFVTAYDEYAVRAFEVHALDYILKPFDRERVQKALERVRIRMRERERGDLATRLEQLLAERAGQRQWPDRIPVRSGTKIELVRAADIDWVEAESNYVVIHAKGRTHVLRETLTSFQQTLDPNVFARIHRSYVVNLSRVRQLRPMFHGEYEVELSDGTRISSGRTYQDAMRRLLDY
jgi:two-component system LytT family response regulator